MKLLVTGGAGYVGSVVAAQLVAQGHSVVVFDDLSTGHPDAVPAQARFIQGDLTKPEDVAGAVTRDLDGVLHFAARSLVGESVEKPDLYWHTNVGGTTVLLDAMRCAGVWRLVFSSTAATYGDPREIPISEDSPTLPTNPYGATKLAIDHMIAAYAKAHSFGAFSLRYFNVAGAHGSLGERHDPETHLIPNVLKAVHHPSAPLKIFGTDWPTPDGTPIRDYIHVTDLGLAHIYALNACAPGTHHIVNLGSGTGYSVREVITTVEKVTGKAVPYEEVGRRAGDPAVLVASNTKAKRLLGWQPERDLTQIVQSTWDLA